MKMKLFTSILCVAFATILMAPTTFAWAETSGEHSLDSGEAIVNILNRELDQGELTDQERVSIINSATFEAKEEYREILQDEVADLLEKEQFTLQAGDTYFHDSIVLDCGARVEITLRDEEDLTVTQQVFGAIERFFVEEANAHSTSLWKNYGDRYFTASMRIIGQGWIDWEFENHYTISDQGIELRKGIHHTAHNGYMCNIQTKHKREDASAIAVGHDVHYLATINWNEKTILEAAGFDFLLGPFERNMRSSVKIVEWDKANQRMYITQSYYSV